MIVNICQLYDCWIYAKPENNDKYEIISLMLLHGYYLGSNNVNNVDSQADLMLMNTTYTGQRRSGPLRSKFWFII
jgi:hypothetical protein